MRTLPLVAGASLALAVSTPLAAQQGPVVTPAEIDAALEAHDGRIASDRALVERVLARGDLRAAAEAAGLGNDLADARAAVAGLDGERLSRAADYARALEQQLAGGQTITVSAVTVIIVLLLVILVVLIAS